MLSSGIAIARDTWFEGWESSKVGKYVPGVNELIKGDMGNWYIGDTVSTECPEVPVPTAAEILSSSKGKYLRLTSENSFSDCADNIWVDYLGLIDVPITQSTTLIFEEYGGSSVQGSKLSIQKSEKLVYYCYFCAVEFSVLDNRDNLIRYILQQDPYFEPISGYKYKTIQLGGAGGIYTRNLYEDFMLVDGFNPVGAKVEYIAFDLDLSTGDEVNSYSNWATIDNILITNKEPPMASFTYTPEDPYICEEITFDASSSYDPDGSIVRYEWDFGDGGSAEGRVVTHTYNKAGDYIVSLMVTDNDGLKDSLLKVVTIKLCKPLIINGHNYKKFDLVFISDGSYTKTSYFLNDISSKINNAYGYVTPIKENMGMFNFYYVDICDKAIINTAFQQFIMPKNFYTKCPFIDVASILHKNEMGDWTNRLFPYPTIFSAEGYETKAFLHESGHAVFGLLDEYDGAPSCSTNYRYPFKPYLNPNTWENESECRNYATSIGASGEWDPNRCRKFTDCQDDWWKLDIGNAVDYPGADPDNYPDDIMTWGNKEDSFGISSRNRIWWYFNSLNNAPKPYGYPITTKSIIVELEMKNSSIRELGSQVIYGEHPNYFDLQGTEFNINFYSNESLLKTYGMYDPRMILVEYGSNINSYRENVNFTLVLPYIENLSIIEIVNSTAILFSFNVSNKTKFFCEQKNGVCDKDCSSDPDCSIIHLNAGWNLISLPLNISNKSAEWLCNQAKCSSIFTFQNKTWKYYYLNKSANTLKYIDGTMGLWIKVNKSLELSLEGFPFKDVKINLSNGWNLIGYPSLKGKEISAVFGNVSVVYSYDDDLWLSYIPIRNYSLNTLSYLVPGYGYWVRKK